MPRIAQIVSTARYLPEREVPNAELTARFAALGRPHVIDKLAASTGIVRRFYAPDNWVTSDLAAAAAKEALKRAGRKPENVDLVIVGTTSPDYVAPNTAVVVQDKVGAKNAGTFDVDCACAAFPAQVAIAAGLLATNPAMKTILLVGVDMIHRLSDPSDPGIFLWGDGAGAAVMEAGDREGFIPDFELFCDSSPRFPADPRHSDQPRDPHRLSCSSSNARSENTTARPDSVPADDVPCLLFAGPL